MPVQKSLEIYWRHHVCLSLCHSYVGPESGIRVVQTYVTIIQWRTDVLLAYDLVDFSQVKLAVNKDVLEVILIVKAAIINQHVTCVFMCVCVCVCVILWISQGFFSLIYLQ